MQEFVNAQAAAAAKSNVVVPSIEELYSDEKINKMVHRTGEKMMESGLVVDRQYEEEGLKLNLIEKLRTIKFDPAIGDIYALAYRIVRRLAGRRLYAIRMEMKRGKLNHSQCVSMDYKIGEELKIEDTVADTSEEDNQIQENRFRKLDVLDGVVASMPRDYQRVWQWLLADMTSTGKYNVAKAAKHFGMERTWFYRKYIVAFKDRFSQAGLRSNAVAQEEEA